MRLKEDVLTYMMSGYIHVSRKDFGFFNNINYQIQHKKPITSNQSKLFDKLLSKYTRQLKKLGYNSLELQNLSWNHPVVETKFEYLQTKISILNNRIVIQSPFNSQFIKHFRIKAGDNFQWNKKDKAYIGEYSTYNLKIAVELTHKFYKDIRYCNHVSQLIDQIKSYKECKYWQPTLIKLDQNFYVIAANSTIMNVISDIILSDDPKILFALSQYGIRIDESVTKGNKILEIAGEYETVIDLDYLDSFCKILNMLEIDHVFTARDIVYNKNISNEIKLVLLEHGITSSNVNSNNHTSGILLKNNTATHYDPKKIKKVITLTNSRPIKVS